MAMPRTDTPRQFWERVAVGDPTMCWLWLGSFFQSSGYGQVWWNGKNVPAHRVAAFLSGFIPRIAAPKNRRQRGFVLHRCDNPPCCNPNHFFIGNYSDNALDSANKLRCLVTRPRDEHPATKLSSQQVHVIRTEYARGGVTQLAIAQRYGVSRPLISAIVNYKDWRRPHGPLGHTHPRIP